jgi:hypothetical protein
MPTILITGSMHMSTTCANNISAFLSNRHGSRFSSQDYVANILLFKSSTDLTALHIVGWTYLTRRSLYGLMQGNRLDVVSRY